MIDRHALEQSHDALTQARDLAVTLTYAVKGASNNEEELRDLVASADTVLEHLVSLIADAQVPLQEALVHAGAAELRAPVAKGGAR